LKLKQLNITIIGFVILLFVLSRKNKELLELIDFKETNINKKMML